MRFIQPDLRQSCYPIRKSGEKPLWELDQQFWAALIAACLMTVSKHAEWLLKRKLLTSFQRQCSFHLWFDLGRSTAAIDKKFTEPTSTQRWANLDSISSDTMSRHCLIKLKITFRNGVSSWVFHWAPQATFRVPASVYEANNQIFLISAFKVAECILVWYLSIQTTVEDVMES